MNTLKKFQSKEKKETKKKMSWSKVKVQIKNNWQLYVMILPVVVYFFITEYMPMYGVQIAFRDYKITQGITGSKWVGFKHFENFFNAYYFERLITNTLVLNILNLVCNFPIPIFLAIFLNQIRNDKRKRFIQTTIYVPHFISTVVLAGMLYIFLGPTTGIFNHARVALGLGTYDFMAEAEAFRWIYVLSGIWQGAGYGTILYIAGLAGVDPGLYEAAEIDGASVWQKIWHIDVPTLIPTAVMVFILDCGKVLSSNTTKTLVLQTAGNISVSDIIGTYTYQIGLNGGQFSYSSAIGLFTNLINLVLILTANKISKKVSSVGLF